MRSSFLLALLCSSAAALPTPMSKPILLSEIRDENGIGRCATHDPHEHRNMNEEEHRKLQEVNAECSADLTGEDMDLFSPEIAGAPTYEIRVAVHVLTCGRRGQLDQACIDGQIDQLNSAFAGEYGGADTGITFTIADSETIHDCMAFNELYDYGRRYNKDPQQYMNVYTSSANKKSGGEVKTDLLGYITAFPWERNAGTNGGFPLSTSGPLQSDRIVINSDAFGSCSTMTGYDEGDTAVHEIGHYLGLYHTFTSTGLSTNDCGAVDDLDCTTTGDLICDTTAQFSPSQGGLCSTYDTCSLSSSAAKNPTNYMDYSYDSCLIQFTEDQATRLRCVITRLRPDIFTESCSGECPPSPPPVLSPPPAPKSPPSPPPETCSNSCNHPSDGDCDDGGPGAEYSSCYRGTDCEDCGDRSSGDEACVCMETWSWTAISSDCVNQNGCEEVACDGDVQSWCMVEDAYCSTADATGTWSYCSNDEPSAPPPLAANSTATSYWTYDWGN